MRKSAHIVAATFIVAFFAGVAEAVLVRTYTTLNEVNQSPDANETVVGGAVDAWTFDSGEASAANAGSFTGNSGANANGSGAGAGDPAWALYANSGATATARANVTGLIGRSLSLAGDSISLDFDNGFIDTNSFVAVQFVDSNGVVASQFSFTGGDPEYQLSDTSTGFTGFGFTGDGFNLALTFTSSSGDYSLDIGGTTLSSRLLAGSVNDIASIEVINASAGNGATRDLYFNNLSIAAIPEVSSAVLGTPLALGLLARLRRGPRREEE